LSDHKKIHELVDGCGFEPLLIAAQGQDSRLLFRREAAREINFVLGDEQGYAFFAAPPMT
jgi:hypothetical protein